MYLTKEQIDGGSEAIFNNGNKLTPPMIEDLLSIFRGYLGPLAEDYPLEETFLNVEDAEGQGQKAAKLAACLALFQENQFTPSAGFEATAANRTGFHYSLDGEVFEIFKYAFGLFWTLPAALSSTSIQRSQMFVSSEGRFGRRGI